jgi:hypothetical protein
MTQLLEPFSGLTTALLIVEASMGPTIHVSLPLAFVASFKALEESFSISLMATRMVVSDNATEGQTCCIMIAWGKLSCANHNFHESLVDTTESIALTS